MNGVTPPARNGRMLFGLSIGLLAAGLVIGTSLDPHPARAEVRRGDWRVLEADFHAHTRFSDGFLSPPGLVHQAQRRRLDVLAVTEHNMILPAQIARAWSQLIGGPTILLGTEITTAAYHLHAIGIRERVPASLPLSELIDEVHRQGGLVIAAHPVRRYWSALLPVLDRLDGMELVHPLSFRESTSTTWNGAHLVEFYEEARRLGVDLTPVASSDYHFGTSLGVPRTLVFAESDSPEDVMEALRAGRTVVYTRDGRPWGDPEAIALLDAEPYEMVDWSDDRMARGWVDHVGRASGLLGLIGLVVFRRR